jgi:hypothetical protein
MLLPWRATAQRSGGGVAVVGGHSPRPRRRDPGGFVQRLDRPWNQLSGFQKAVNLRAQVLGQAELNFLVRVHSDARRFLPRLGHGGPVLGGDGLALVSNWPARGSALDRPPGIPPLGSSPAWALPGASRRSGFPKAQGEKRVGELGPQAVEPGRHAAFRLPRVQAREVDAVAAANPQHGHAAWLSWPSSRPAAWRRWPFFASNSAARSSFATVLPVAHGAVQGVSLGGLDLVGHGA